MNSPEDEIPLPSEGVLSDEETSRQLRADSVRQYTERIKLLEERLEAAQVAIEHYAEWRTDSSLEKWFPITAEELQKLREDNANSCACRHDGRGNLTDECQEHKAIRTERDQLKAQLNTARLEALSYALGLVQGRRVLNRTPAYIAALDEIEIFLRASIERVEKGEPMYSEATCQDGNA